MTKSRKMYVKTENGIKAVGGEKKIVPPTDKQVKMWAEMTDWNDHAGVKIEIAQWWKEQCKRIGKKTACDYVMIFKEVVEIREHENGLRVAISEMCYAAFLLLLDEIERVGGIELRQRVEEGL